MRKRPLIWVSGPPGCGKTTLVASYLDARRLPCLWYQIDQGDADPATFFYYLGLAAKKAAPRKRKPLPLLTPEYLQGISTFALRYFEELYSRLNLPKPRLNPPSPPMPKSNPPTPPFDKGGIKGGFVVVFDNYHEVPADSSFHEVILNGLSRIPEGINVILISRSDPPPALIRLRANHQMEILGWEELRLTQKESEGIIRLRAQAKKTKETVSLLHKAADGWAAGLVLMLESVERKVIEPQALGKLTPDEIMDYFGKELLDKTDREIQGFLLQTAFLPKMTPKMAEDLTGLPNAGRILDALSRSHYFTEKRFRGEPVYQYHSLFREFLLSRAKGTFSADTLSVLLRQAAKLLEDDGQSEAAIGVLCDIGDWNGMVRLVLMHAPSMVEQGRNRSLEEWLSSLPKDIMENNPWLLYWMGEGLLPLNPSRSREYFQKAFKKFKSQENPAGIFLSWSGVVESIRFGFDNFKQLNEWTSALEELMHDLKEFPSKEIEARVASSMFFSMVFAQPQHPMVEEWEERTFASAESHTNINGKILALYRVAFYRLHIGDFRKAALVIHSLQQLPEYRDAAPFALITVRLVEAIYYRYLGEHEKCLQAVSDGLKISHNTGIHIVDRILLYHGISSALNVNDLATANRLLEKMGTARDRFKPWDTSFYHLLRTREALRRADIGRASLHIDSALKLSFDVGAPFSLVLCHLTKAHVMHELGKDQEAREQLAHTFQIARDIRGPIFEFYALLAQALFALDQGKEVSALISLRKALTLGKRGGYFNTFIDQPFAMARLCTKALEAGIEVVYVQELVQKLNIIPEKPPLHLENWPWPLKIFTLGRFELLKDGQSIRFSRKTQQKPLAMLKVLIALGGKEVREDQITDALWPEADGDMAHQSFETTLHRLRHLLGQEKAIQLKEGRLTLDERFCWVDVWAFEHLLGEAEVRWKKGQMDRGIQLIEKAIALYHGAFLAREMEEPWTMSTSERLRTKFLQMVGKLGDYRQQAGQWDKALECYQKGLEVDDLAEEFCQGLMTCYQRLDRKAEALTFYHRYQKRLSTVLGLEPSAKTLAIYKTLSGNAKV